MLCHLVPLAILELNRIYGAAFLAQNSTYGRGRNSILWGNGFQCSSLSQDLEHYFGVSRYFVHGGILHINDSSFVAVEEEFVNENEACALRNSCPRHRSGVL